MKQRSIESIVAEARAHAKGNRKEIEASKYAGCFSCCHVFDSNAVTDWRDEWVSPETQNRVLRWTAICPRCNETTVVGSASGLLEDQAYLPIIQGFLNDSYAPNQ